MSQDGPIMTLNIRSPALQGLEGDGEGLRKAVETRKLHNETFDEAWARILSMKNSPRDVERLQAVKVAMQSGDIGRDNANKKFSKSEAMDLWRIIDAKHTEDRLRQMVEDTPDNYWLITDEAKLGDFLGILDFEDEIVFDVETTGTDVWSDYLVGHVITAVEHDIHAYIPTRHDDVRPQLDHAYVLDKLRPIYEDASLGKIAHNAGFDIHILDREGIALKGLTWDTLEAMKLLNENEPSFALKPLVTKYLREPSQTYGELFGKRGFDEIPLDEALAYAAKDGDVTLKLRNFQRHHLAKMPEVLTYYETVEVPLIPIIVEMEKEGYVIDLGFAETYGEQLRKECAVSYAKVVESLGDINLNSPMQLKTAIEAHIGKEIENTNAGQTLKPLSREYPIIAELLKYREKNKLLTTYIDALPELISEKTGRLHTQFNQNGAKTGRFSSGGGGSFNIQNQPRDARNMFVAPDGYYIVNADFAAQEVRMIASESREQVLLDAFAEGRDAYASLASEFFNKPYEACYKLPNGDDTEERKRMKVVLLMSMYGASKYGLAQALDITPDEATKFLDDFFKKYRKIDEFIKRTQVFANKNGYVWIGDKARKRRLPDARGDVRRYDPKRNRAMRQGPNARIQGLAAIQTKVTLIKLSEVAQERGWIIWGAIHDEIIVLMPTNASAEDFRILDEVMTQSYVIDGVDNASDIELQLRWGNSITADDFLRGKPVPESDLNIREGAMYKWRN